MFLDKKHVFKKTKEQPKDKGQGDPPPEKLANKGLPIVKNHKKAVITEVFGVIGTPSRSYVNGETYR